MGTFFFSVVVVTIVVSGIGAKVIVPWLTT